MRSISAPSSIEETSKLLNFEYLVNLIRLFSIADCGLLIRAKCEFNLKSKIGNLTVLSRLGQIVIDHAAPVFLSLCNCGIAAFFIATDFVLSVKTFEDELASGNKFGCFGALEIKWDEGRFKQLWNRLNQSPAFVGGCCIGEQQFIAFIKPFYG